MENKNTVSFHLKDNSAKTVAVVGNFNNWQPGADFLMNTGNGEWMLEKELIISGNYRYKYLIDGWKWIHDSFNPLKEKDGYGGYNSILEIKFKEAPEVNLDFLLGNEKILDSTKPTWGSTSERKKALESLDSLFMFPAIANCEFVNNFYIGRLTKAIQTIEKERIKSGIRVWQLYNHGVLIETPDLVIGFDVISTKTAWRIYWNIPRTLIERLVSLLDVLLVSHRHSDHLDLEIAGRMFMKKKLFFVPDELEIWFRQKANVLNPEEEHRYRGLSIVAHKGAHVYDIEKGTKIKYYEVMLPNGFNILHTSDHDYTFFIKVKRQVDLLIPKCGGITYFHSARESMETVINKLHPRYIIPGHLIELGHDLNAGRKGFQSAYNTLTDLIDNFEVLFWGESIVIPS